jgi:3-hydroxyisobutyrate dehydrogenase-like beta-hydroxyacid dehydrogenase
VTGGARLRTQGKIVVLAGGSEAAIEAARPVLEAFAAPLLHMGPLGAGLQAKLASNLMHYSAWHAAWEAARVVAAAGVDVEKFIEAYECRSRWGDGAMGLLGRGIGPGPAGNADQASLDDRHAMTQIAKKDLAYVLASAAELGVGLPGAELVRSRMDRVVGLEQEPGPLS